MNLDLFLGRFHPLIVHLPIGFLMLAVILEGLSRLSKDRFKGLDSAISITILCGGIAALLSSILGLLLASGGGYDNQTLFWHKWSGIVLTIVVFIGWVIKSGYINVPKSASSYILIVLFVMVAITGHLGGNLTHGSDYLLAYAPSSFKNFFGQTEDQTFGTIPSSPDSIHVYMHLVKPALEVRCYECHNESKKKGELVLTTVDGINTGGETGNLLARLASESLLFQRITLPKSNQKFMPPKGEPLNYSEIKLIEWWINNGASFTGKLSEYKISDEIKGLLLCDYGIDITLKPIYDRLAAPKLSSEAIAQIENAGFYIKPLAPNHSLYEVGVTTTNVQMKDLEILLIAAEQITWLNLDNKSISDEMLQDIGKISNLTRLRLQNNPITDDGINHLLRLKHLESLNVYGTSVTDESLEEIKGMLSLQRVYLWKTRVSDAGVQELVAARPDLNVQFGVENH